jgi:hypothetical protein
MPPEYQFGAFASYFGLNFGDGFGTSANGYGSYANTGDSYTIVPESPPNVAIWSPSQFAVVQPAPGGVAFDLSSVYVGYLSPALGQAYTVYLTGSFQGVPATSCSYSILPAQDEAPSLLETPDCVSLDQIQITDNNGQYWFIDNMNVTIYELTMV